MNKIDQLFIRACKSEGLKRVQSVHRRFYATKDTSSVYIAGILARICHEHLLYNTVDLINDLNPDNAWKYSNKKVDTYLEHVVNVLISKIRLTEVIKFDGLTSPLMFRK